MKQTLEPQVIGDDIPALAIMSRREMIKTSGAVGLGTALTATGIGGTLLTMPLVNPGCDTGDIADNIEIVIDAFGEASPIFQQLGFNDVVTRLSQASAIGSKVLEALRKQDNPETVVLIGELISVFQVIANDSKLLPIPNQVTVLAILGGANVALHFVQRWLKKQEPQNQPAVARAVREDPRAARAASVIEAFGAELEWGKLIKKKD